MVVDWQGEWLSGDTAAWVTITHAGEPFRALLFLDPRGAWRLALVMWGQACDGFTLFCGD